MGWVTEHAGMRRDGVQKDALSNRSGMERYLDWRGCGMAAMTYIDIVKWYLMYNDFNCFRLFFIKYLMNVLGQMAIGF